ncbi:MAG TPA: ArsA-related P-loop ATPase [Candidatus Binataceae bacterium]|nr:ArsA-related P-loop ATPase [Candidatus Binataceae bacterium]
MNWPRLILTLGKGGSGKTTAACALALHLARSHPTVLAGLDHRRSAARLLELEGNDTGVLSQERLTLITLDARGELERFIERLVPLAAVSRRLIASRTFGYVAAALPGLESFVLLSRMATLAWQAACEDRYVVVDGLSTGTTLELLAVAPGMRRVANRGTLNRLALDLEGFLADPARFGAAVVIEPQELALREGLAAVNQLRQHLGVQRVSVILNGVPAPLFAAADLRAARPLGASSARLMRRRTQIDDAVRRARRQLRAAVPDLIELPLLFSPSFGQAEVLQLSRALSATS